jgi:6-phosphofructokinase 1
MITINSKSEVMPLYLKDVEDENGKVKPRLVDVNSQSVQLIFRNNLHYITKEDYRAAKKYVKNPEEYDFFNILEWEQK